MNKKIKVIELLNKIANGEEVPNKIKIFGIVFVWFEGSYRKEDANLEYISDYCRLDCMLNDEIEILEDNTEDKGYELLKTIKNENDFEQLGYEVGKLSIAIAKGLEKAIKEMRKDLNK